MGFITNNLRAALGETKLDEFLIIDFDNAYKADLEANEKVLEKNKELKKAALARLNAMAQEAGAFKDFFGNPITLQQALQTERLMTHNMAELALFNQQLYEDELSNYVLEDLPYMLSCTKNLIVQEKDLNNPIYKADYFQHPEEYFNCCTNNGNMDKFLTAANEILRANLTEEQKLQALGKLNQSAKKAKAFTETLNGRPLSAYKIISLGYKGDDVGLYENVRGQLLSVITAYNKQLEEEQAAQTNIEPIQTSLGTEELPIENPFGEALKRDQEIKAKAEDMAAEYLKKNPSYLYLRPIN